MSNIPVRSMMFDDGTSQRLSRTKIPVRLQGAAIDYHAEGIYVLWLNTVNWRDGTYLELHPCGKIVRTTEQDGEVVDTIVISPSQRSP